MFYEQFSRKKWQLGQYADKSLEYAWDDMVKRFFKKRQIAFELLVS